jgi:phosphoribosylamine--glycine ligase
MKLLVIGSGAREHALAWAAGRHRPAAPERPVRTLRGHEIFCAPGNAGTAGVARNLAVDPSDRKAVVAACRELGIDLVVIGPEGPLAAGLADALRDSGIPAFGPGAAAARLEACKAEARAFAERHHIPCAATSCFAAGSGLSGFHAFLDARRGQRLVLKKSGLTAGKRVLESNDPAELAAFGDAVLSSDGLLAEEFLAGRELSVFTLCSEKGWRLLEPAAACKKALAKDRGPITGGMGAVSPLPFADAALMSVIGKDIVEPTFEGMAAEGLSYRGALFFGMIVTAEGPRLLDYNVRFGDPEAQSLLPRLQGDFAEFCADVAAGRLPAPVFGPSCACGVVVAAPGYPIAHPRGLPVDLADLPASVALGRPEVELDSAPAEPGFQALLFQAATGRDGEGGLRTGGGRCFTAVGLGPDWRSARDRAYKLANLVRFEGAWYRPDIGEKIYGT